MKLTYLHSRYTIAPDMLNNYYSVVLSSIYVLSILNTSPKVTIKLNNIKTSKECFSTEVISTLHNSLSFFF